jgi:hypothetical protein
MVTRSIEAKDVVGAYMFSALSSYAPGRFEGDVGVDELAARPAKQITVMSPSF